MPLLAGTGPLLSVIAGTGLGQLSFWNSDEPCHTTPTLEFDALVDIYFMVRPLPRALRQARRR